MKLTLSNFEAFQDYVHPSLLPRTFVEAMEIITNFGIRYLWIDSLCIIQDSQKDWQSNRLLWEASIITHGITWWRREIDDTELNHREWVVQELILSPRNLYLGSQTFWQCLELHSCEAYPNRPLNLLSKLSMDTLSLGNELLKAESEIIKQYQLWTMIV